MNRIIPTRFDISCELDLETNKEMTVMIFESVEGSWSFVVPKDAVDLGLELLSKRLSPDHSPESVNRTLDLIYKRLTQRDDGLG